MATELSIVIVVHATSQDLAPGEPGWKDVTYKDNGTSIQYKYLMTHFNCRQTTKLPVTKKDTKIWHMTTKYKSPLSL